MVTVRIKTYAPAIMRARMALHEVTAPLAWPPLINSPSQQPLQKLLELFFGRRPSAAIETMRELGPKGGALNQRGGLCLEQLQALLLVFPRRQFFIASIAAPPRSSA